VRDPRRSIPAVDRLLSSPEFELLLAEWPRVLVTDVVRREIEVLRERAAHGEAIAVEPHDVAAQVAAVLHRLAGGSLGPVINATGVVLHTNLGRAPLASAALEAVQRVAAGYSNLEYDRATGGRGSRYTHCRELLQHLTGADDAVIVNNNAAALVLALNTVARGFEAIVSRGELVEIGGAFRVPEIMARSGARLREVGSTNRTHVDDYRAALGSATGAVLKVHPSNFSIEGYTAEVSVQELAPVARQGGVPLVHDIGSGLLLDPERLGLGDEPTPRRSLAAGADIVTMSGDKLLGGPQCGIVLGSSSLIEHMRSNPLCRALRVDKMTIAALEATLRLYLDPDRALREIPVLRMLTLHPADLRRRATALAETCRHAGYDVALVAGESAVGGGAASAAALETTLVLLRSAHLTAARLESALRAGSPPVVVRIVDDRVALDLRTVPVHDEDALLAALQAAG
jgi:L-seryl-tRNA(Ser) seleniumtransferase